MLSVKDPPLGKMSMLLGGALLAVLLGFTNGHTADREPAERLLSTIEGAPRHILRVIESSALIAAGVKLGTAVLYDDPSTPRSADYLELYDSRGGLVAVSWFDRFGIERMAMDRAFLQGKEKLEGVFVAIVDEDGFI